MSHVFAKRIKELRESQGLSTRGLAEKLNIGASSISQYETDIRTPDIEVCKKFADFFGVSCDYLIGISDNPTPYKGR